MRACAVSLLVLGALAFATGCGDDDPGAPSGKARTGSKSAVTPADYALRVERRCRSIVVGGRRLERIELRVRRGPTPAGERRYLKEYGAFLQTSDRQFQRLARLSVPGGREYRNLHAALGAVAQDISSSVGGGARRLARDPSPSTYSRVRRDAERAASRVPAGLFPAEIQRRTPSCNAILRPTPQNGRQGAPGSLSA